MIAKYQNPEWDGKVPDQMHYHEGYIAHEDDYGFVHDRVCAIDRCDDCEEEREDRYFSRYGCGIYGLRRG